MNKIKAIVEEQLNTTGENVVHIGSGNTASCYCVDINESPYKLLIKTSKHYKLTYEEKKMNDFLRQRVNFKIPETNH